MKYTVIALSVGGLGNKIFRSGDIVDESNFPEGNAPELVEQGFLKPNTEVKAEDLEIDGVRTYDDWTVKELRKELRITDPKVNKSELYALWLETQ